MVGWTGADGRVETSSKRGERARGRSRRGCERDRWTGSETGVRETRVPGLDQRGKRERDGEKRRGEEGAGERGPGERRLEDVEEGVGLRNGGCCHWDASPAGWLKGCMVGGWR